MGYCCLFNMWRLKLIARTKNVETISFSLFTLGGSCSDLFGMIALGFNANKVEFNCNLAIPSEIIKDTCK